MLIAFQAMGETIPVGLNVAQLFIDDYLIASQEGLKRTLHQPRKDNGGRFPLIEPPEGEGAILPHSIIYDSRLRQYVMYISAYPSNRHYRLLSSEGMNWIYENKGHPHSIHIDLAYPGKLPPRTYAGLLVHYDQQDTEYPYKGWLYAANWGNDLEGMYYTQSRDGLKWKRGHQVINAFADRDDPSCRIIRQDGRILYGPGDATSFYYDAVQKRFLCLIKFFTPDRVEPGNNLRSRAYCFFNRLDEPFDSNRIKHIELIPPAAKINNDQPFDEYYSSDAWRYGSLWLGSLTVWHRGDDYKWSAAGCSFLKLLVSRDGLHWKKVPFANDDGIPEVFIPNGPEGGNKGKNDGGYMGTFGRGPFRIGNELIYYYGCTSFGKNHPPGEKIRGGGVFRSRLRIDGFVSADAGSLTTKKLAFDGKTLYINGVGPVRVELLGRQNQLLGSSEIIGDSIRHEVKFNNLPLREVAPNGVVQLRFTIKPPGRLYSFMIR